MVLPAAAAKRSPTSLDDVILTVFETDDDQFYFPVTSQGQARAFVKALYARGVKYSSICAAVDVPEQNFTAWRTGLGRHGVGNRVIERINRPVQELLLQELVAEDQRGRDDVDGRPAAGNGEAAGTTSGLHGGSTNGRLEDASTILLAEDGDDFIDGGVCLGRVRFEPFPSPRIESRITSRRRAGRTRLPLDTAEVEPAVAVSMDSGSTVAKPSCCQSAETHEDKNAAVVCQLEVVGKEESESGSSLIKFEADKDLETTDHVENLNHSSGESLMEISEAQGKELVCDTATADNKVDNSATNGIDRSLHEAGEFSRKLEEAIEPESKPEVKIEENKKTVDALDGSIFTAADSEDKSIVTATETTSHENEDKHINVAASDVDETNSSTDIGDDLTKTACGVVEQVDRASEHQHEQDSHHQHHEVIVEQAVCRPSEKCLASAAPENLKSEILDVAESSSTATTSKVISKSDRQHCGMTETTHDENGAGKSSPPDVVGVVDVKSCLIDPSNGSISGVVVSPFAATDGVEDHNLQLSGVSAENQQMTVTRVARRSTRRIRVRDPDSEEKDETSMTFSNGMLLEKNGFGTMPTKCEEQPVHELVKGLASNGTQEKSGVVVTNLMTGCEVELIHHESLVVESAVLNGGKNGANHLQRKLSKTAEKPHERYPPQATTAPKTERHIIDETVSSNNGQENHMNHARDNNGDSAMVSENYDSDPDTTRNGDMQKRHCRDEATDGPGYIYAFTDSHNNSTEFRVKVAGSRNPFGRLRQATLFNVDIRLVSAVPVSARCAASRAIHDRLKDLALKGTTDWFTGRLDDIVQAVMDVCRQFPVPVDTN